MGEIIGCSRKIAKKMMGRKLNTRPLEILQPSSEYLAWDDSRASCLHRIFYVEKPKK